MHVIRVHRSIVLKKGLILIFAVLFVYWLVFRREKYKDSFSEIVSGVEPKAVWDFVADFTNWQRINPGILEFEIESENGNYENWEYFVVYKDYSLTVPFIQYQNRANFKVLPKTLNHNERSHRFQNPYRILSQFTTCALGICFESASEMKFSVAKSGKATRIEELVEMDCPKIFSSFCFKDLKAQKRMMYENILSSVDVMS